MLVALVAGSQYEGGERPAHRSGMSATVTSSSAYILITVVTHPFDGMSVIPFTKEVECLQFGDGLGAWDQRFASDNTLGSSDQLRQRYFERRRELEEVAVARISQPALDLTDVSAMHSSKVSESLLGQAVDFPSPRAYRFAKSLKSRLRHAPSLPAISLRVYRI
jgi:hypothetical protein